MVIPNRINRGGMEALNSHQISLALSKAGYTDEVFAEHEVIAKAQFKQDIEEFTTLLEDYINTMETLLLSLPQVKKITRQ